MARHVQVRAGRVGVRGAKSAPVPGLQTLVRMLYLPSPSLSPALMMMTVAFLECRYTPPPFLRHFTTKGVDRSPLLLLCGAGAARGRRPYMEDVHCCFPAVNISGGGSNVCSVYGVLDGHGGVECSRFAVEEMPPQIVAALRSGLSSSQALFNSFTNTDEVKSANMCVVFGSLLSEYNFCY